MTDYVRITQLPELSDANLIASGTAIVPIVSDISGNDDTYKTSIDSIKTYLESSGFNVSGDSIITGNLTINGNVAWTGATTSPPTTISSSGNFVNIQTDANLTMRTSNNGYDVGSRLFYYKTNADVAALVWRNANRRLTWYESGVGNDANYVSGGAVLGAMEVGSLFVSNVTPGALQVAGGSSVTGNLYVGGLSTLTGNVTAGNVSTGTVSASNVSVGTLATLNSAQVNSYLSVGTTLNVGGSVTVNALTANTTITGAFVGNVTGNASGSSSKWATARTITLGGDLTGNASIDGSANVTLTATVAANSVALGTDTTGNYVASIANGSYLTGGAAGSEGAALTLGVDATSTSTANKVVARDADGSFSANIITASAFVGNIIGNLTGVAVESITHVGTTGVGDIGSSSNRFGTIYGTAVSALYADLAEKYIADADYDVGTVVIFGGTSEITVTDKAADTRVAGVISDSPAYIMNSGSTGLAVALRGKVPVKVIGAVNKGDLLVTTNVPGVATSVDYLAEYNPHAVFAKSLEDDNNAGQRMIMAVIL